MANTLFDNFGRQHDYLRISLIERCNLRCTYCMPEEGIQLRDKSEFMTQEELIHLAKTFVDLGVRKIRLTGGEPLIKKDFAEILFQLGQLPVELAITTNGVLLDKYFSAMRKAGLKKLNISLDSLNEEKFNAISRRKNFKRIWKNINTAVSEGFDVKINVVLMKNVNDNEIIDFIRLSKSAPLKIRFIEFMPFNGNEWDWTKTVKHSEIIDQVDKYYAQQYSQQNTKKNSTSKNYKINGFKGDFGIISTLTNPFCDGCNRIRLTADGKIKNCLFSSNETDLLTALRNGEDILPLIKSSIQSKHEKKAGIKTFRHDDDASIYNNNRSMTTIGG